MKSSSELQVEGWLLKLAIHQPFEITTSAQSVVKSILTYAGTLDMYCPACAKMSTFKGDISTETENIAQSEKFAANGFNVSSSFWLHTIFSKQLSCTREGHAATFYFHIDDGKLYKVGQYPSLASIAIGDALQYLPVLGLEIINELNQAVTLAADGACLGALVYFKRVLAHLFNVATEQLKLEQAQAKEVDFNALDFQAKATLLTSVLPKLVTEQVEVLRFLDKDLTALTDNECLPIINTVRAMIVLLADERLATTTREANEMALLGAIK